MTTTIAKVRSVEPVSYSFLIRSFHTVFFFDGYFPRSFARQWNFFQQIITQILSSICLLQLKSPCYFINDAIYGVNNFLNFHAQYVNSDNYFYPTWFSSKYIVLSYFCFLLLPTITRDIALQSKPRFFGAVCMIREPYGTFPSSMDLLFRPCWKSIFIICYDAKRSHGLSEKYETSNLVPYVRWSYWVGVFLFRLQVTSVGDVTNIDPAKVAQLLAFLSWHAR